MKFKGTNGPWELKHSESKNAWNIIGTNLGTRYKIARLSYFTPFENVPDQRREYDKLEQKTNALLISKAPEILNQLYDLAMLSIQSDRYREDAEFKIVVDKAFELLRQATNI